MHKAERQVCYCNSTELEATHCKFKYVGSTVLVLFSSVVN